MFALADKILPAINCDRTLDVSVTARTYSPKNGRIVLKPLKAPHEHFSLLGYSTKTYDELQDQTTFQAEVERLCKPWHDNWPLDTINNIYWTAAMWSVDMRCVAWTPNVGYTEIDANIDFPPMRVDTVFDEPARIEYTYCYRDEFERALPTAVPGIFTTEEFDDGLIVLINGTANPKRLILPKPLQVINRTDTYAGDVEAPAKFASYLIDSIAVTLSMVYGLSTQASMEQSAAKSYNLLTKNLPQPFHKINVNQAIGETLNRAYRAPVGGVGYGRI